MRRPAARLGAAAAVVSALVGVVSGCASGSGRPAAATSTSIPSPVDACTPSRTQWRTLAGLPVNAATAGSGPAVIFANDSGNDVCGWLPLADRLAASGHRVAVFTYSNPSALSDPDNLKTLLGIAARTAEGRRFVLIGASIGGRLVIEAAARPATGLAGIVSLSGEARLPAARDITADAMRVSIPALYVGARLDGYTKGTTQQNALHQAMHGTPNELLQRPGSAHGTTLLTGSDGHVVVPAVIDFLGRVLR